MNTLNRNQLNLILVLILSITGLFSCTTETNWLKGNMHTHTFWSDGQDFPENVARWYNENGYDFLVFTDHNILHKTPEKSLRPAHVFTDGQLWQRIQVDHPALAKYDSLFGEDWVETRPDDEQGYLQVRLKTMDEYGSLFKDPGKFLILMGNEITNMYVHFLAIYQEKQIPATKGTADDRVRMMKEVVEQFKAYREESGSNIYPVLAHPNHRWSITAEMILDVPELRFFEVYNGIPGTSNDGEGFRAGTARMWDIVLANRLARGEGELLYGLATDDAHYYYGQGSGPGRGWIMVNSDELTPGSILDALDKGDFYASTGVTLKKLKFNGKTLKVEIEPQEGIEYLTEFIGTFEGFDTTSVATLDTSGVEISNTTRTYSEQIGKILYSSNDPESSYTFTGKELYVRVCITSTADQYDPISGNIIGKQKAWIQPHVNTH